MSLTRILELVNIGDTLRDSAGNTYSVDNYNGDFVGEFLTVTRQSDKQQRDVSAAVAWAMMESGQLWKDAKKRRRTKA